MDQAAQPGPPSRSSIAEIAIDQDEQGELSEQLRELFDKFCDDDAALMTREALLTFCQECSLLDKTLSEADVDLVFQSVKVGKKPGR